MRAARERRRSGVAVVALAAALSVVASARPAAAAPVVFTDVTVPAGVYHQHFTVGSSEFERTAGGVAAGDYDRDGWIDLYVVRGDAAPNLLFRNRGDGTFEEVGEAAGVRLPLGVRAGPTFADYDGDGWLDLVVLGDAVTLFRNRRDGTFENVTAASGLVLPGQSYSAAFGDYDRDGDLDLAASRWANQNLPPAAPGSLWRNDGGTFVDVSQAAGVPLFFSRTDPILVQIGMTLSFTPNFVDYDSDGRPDLLVAGDFGASYVLHNRGDGTFEDATTSVVSDENGMGAAIGDVDADGDLDWFVSSIWDPNGIVEGNWGTTGNRYYRNDGAAGFVDATDAAGLRQGYWGWASTFLDVENDGDLDLFHVNGWGQDDPDSAEYHADPSRLFVNAGDATFTEKSADFGIVDTGQGRGVVAFDYDRDGDLDLFVTNNKQPARLLRNDGGNANGFLVVKLVGQGRNSEAIGARVLVTTGGSGGLPGAPVGALQQMRELRAGSNFQSQDPAEAHFGLGAAAKVDELRIEWPNGAATVMTDLAPNQWLMFASPAADGGVCDAAAPANGCTPGRGAAKQACWLEWHAAATPARDKKGVPGAKLACREGDPACDADPDLANRSCTIRAELCAFNLDPRLPKCVPAALASLAVESPKPSKLRDAADIANHAALTEQIARVAGLRAPGDVGKLVDVTKSRCVEAGAFTVPLKVSKKGKLSKGTRKLLVTGTNAAGKRAKAQLQLECLPP